MKRYHPIESLRLPTVLSAMLLFLLSGTAACGQTEQSKEEKPKEPKVTHRVVFVTSFGEIEMELYGEDAPMTVANFVGLIDSGFYNGILFHRVHPNFLIQTGDPGTKDSTVPQNKWGLGGASIYRSPFPDELNLNAPSYKRGYLRGVMAMANSGPNTNMSQFFILLRDVPKLPKQNTIFGRVVRGLNVVDSIGTTKLTDITEYGGKPTTPIAIISARTLPPTAAVKEEE